MKNQTKWLCAMAALSCLLISAVEVGNRVKRFWQQDGGNVKIQRVVENDPEDPLAAFFGAVFLGALLEDTGEVLEGTAAGQKVWRRETGGEKENFREIGREHREKKREDRIPGRALSGLSGISLGIQGILKGSLGLAKRTLALKSGLAEGSVLPGPGLLPEPEPQAEEEPEPPMLYLTSDLHYMSEAATDYGEAFEIFQAKSDGKITRYLPQVLDAFLEETACGKPDALILTGDISMDGEKLNHIKLAEKLARLQESGIQVLVIPGNHDINNASASVYFGEKAERAEAVTFEEFKEIYKDFGWNQAASRDEASFSYVYVLREGVWLMLLDTAQYDPVNLVEGRVREETLRWMEENLKAADEQGAQVIVLGHHNLLSESRMFTAMCILENGGEVTELLENHRLPLYISGHLHLQRTNQHKKGPGETGYGIYEIVSDAFSIPPCQYGVLTWKEDGDIWYHTRQVDVNSWAKAREDERGGEENENLLNFSEYKQEYILQIIGDQIKEETKQVRETTANDMAKIYAKAYADYCAGVEIDQRQAMRSPEYKLWEGFWPRIRQAVELRTMLGDCSRDYNEFVVRSGSDNP